MVAWKKKHWLDPSTKVFIVHGGYGSIKNALLEWGWFRNKDSKSPCYDLKWVLRAKDVNHKALEDHQIVNHFPKSTSITTKIGLSRSMKQLLAWTSIDPDTFFPKCYDLTDPEDFDSFKEMFMLIKAESIVKKFYHDIETIDEKVLKTAMDICERWSLGLDEIIDMKDFPE